MLDASGNSDTSFTLNRPDMNATTDVVLTINAMQGQEARLTLTEGSDSYSISHDGSDEVSEPGCVSMCVVLCVCPYVLFCVCVHMCCSVCVSMCAVLCVCPCVLFSLCVHVCVAARSLSLWCSGALSVTVLCFRL